MASSRFVLRINIVSDTIVSDQYTGKGEVTYMQEGKLKSAPIYGESAFGSARARLVAAVHA